MMPFAYEDSPFRCPRCPGKRLVMDIGQDSDTGWVHEHHWCISCDYSVRERPRAAKSLTVAEILARRSAHLDTPAVRERLGLAHLDREVT